MNKFLTFPLLILAFQMFGQTIEHYEKLALASFYAKDFPTSLLYNEKIIEMDDGNTASLFFAAESARKMNDLSKAEAYLEKIPNEAKAGYFAVTDYHLGLVKQGLNKRDEAKNYYESYLNNHHSEYDLYSHLATNAIHSLATGSNWVEEGSYIAVLPDNINTERADMAPLRYANKLYFSSVLEENYLPTKNKKKSKRMVKRPVLRIYEAQFNQKSKESTANPRSAILNASNVSLMPDASRMYYTLCTDENPESQEHCTIWFRNRFYDGTWGPAIKLPQHINYRHYTNTQPSVGYDWTLKKYMLYFVSNRPGGIGGKDIWCAPIEKDDTFGEPSLMPFNTPLDDVTPFFHQQSQTLFFSSKGWDSKGGFDIFHTEKTNASEWEVPQNMGPYLNTANDELYYTYHTSSKFAYFVAGTVGKNKVETDVLEARVFVNLQIRAFNKESKNMVNGVEIEIEDVATGNKGVFNTGKESHSSIIKLSPGAEYRIKVTRPGYHPFSFDMDTNRISYFKTLEENVFLQPFARP